MLNNDLETTNEESRVCELRKAGVGNANSGSENSELGISSLPAENRGAVDCGFRIWGLRTRNLGSAK